MQGNPAPIVQYAGVVLAALSAGISLWNAGVTLWTRAAVAELKNQLFEKQQAREDKLKTEFTSVAEFQQLDHRVDLLERKAIIR